MKDVYLKRIATNDDVIQIREMFLSIFPEEKYHLDDCIDAFSDSIISNDIDHQLDYYFAYDRETKEIVGVTGVYAQDPDTAWLGWFGVRPAFREQKYGRTILNQTMDLMRSLGYRYIRLYSDPKADAQAIKLYESVGFIKDSTYDDHTITMKMPLYDGIEPPTDWVGKPYGM